MQHRWQNLENRSLATDIDQADISWLRTHLELYRRALSAEQIIPKLVELKSLIMATHARQRKVIFVGNGGSAAIASHCPVDFTTVTPDYSLFEDMRFYRQMGGKFLNPFPWKRIAAVCTRVLTAIRRCRTHWPSPLVWGALPEGSR